MTTPYIKWIWVPTVALALGGCHNTTGGGQDLTSGMDLSVTTRDLTAGPPDLTAPGPDLFTLSDLSIPPDLIPPADLTPPPDMLAPNTVVVGYGGGVAFGPMSLKVTVGTTVTWVWASGGHNVVSGAVPGTPDNLFCSPSDATPCNTTNAPTSATGATYTHKFTTAGTFPYFCRPHAASGMVGTIIVM